MRNYVKIVWMSMIAGYLLGNTAVIAQSLDIVTIFKPPLSTIEGTGVIDSIVKEAFSRIGMKVQIIPGESASALEKANKGIYDGDLLRIGDSIITEKYPNMIQVPESFYTFEFVAFSKNINEPMNGWESLKPYRVGIPSGWVIIENNVKEDNSKSRVKITSPFELFNSMIKGETDLVIYERLMSYQIIRESNFSEIHPLEPPLATKPMFLYLNNKHKDIVPKVAAALADMKKDGTIKRLLDEALNAYKK